MAEHGAVIPPHIKPIVNETILRIRRKLPLSTDSSGRGDHSIQSYIPSIRRSLSLELPGGVGRSKRKIANTHTTSEMGRLRSCTSIYSVLSTVVVLTEKPTSLSLCSKAAAGDRIDGHSNTTCTGYKS